MKKILSLTLVLAMVMSMGITTAFAAGNWEGGTQVTYTATGAEEWTVTVPATLTPGNAGDVTAAGTWGSNRKLVVTADDNVTLTNSINAADQKVLDVTFADINLVGDNTKSVSETKQVSVAAMPADALFGTWSGTFYYDVEMVDNVEIKSLTIAHQSDETVSYTIQYEEGMTWAEWCDSGYNTVDAYYYDDQLEGPKVVFSEGYVCSTGYLHSYSEQIDANIDYFIA